MVRERGAFESRRAPLLCLCVRGTPGNHQHLGLAESARTVDPLPRGLPGVAARSASQVAGSLRCPRAPWAPGAGPAALTAPGLRRPSTHSQGRPAPRAGAPAALPLAASPPDTPRLPLGPICPFPARPPRPRKKRPLAQALQGKPATEEQPHRARYKSRHCNEMRASSADRPLERGLQAVHRNKRAERQTTHSGTFQMS